MLLWDGYKAHIFQRIKKAHKQRRGKQAVIPGGWIGEPQAKDISFNKPFQAKVC